MAAGNRPHDKMAITVKQWQRATDRITKTYTRAVLAAMKAGNNIANRRAKYFYIKDRAGPPIAKFLTKRTGNLRDSIKMVEPKYTGKFYVMGLRAGSPGVRYAGHEFGFPRRNIRARPYLNPALRDAQPQMNNQIALAIETLYRKNLR